MKTFAQTIDLVNDPQIIEKYEEYHRNVWPEVIESLKSIGINRMEIFRSANHLFMYCQAKDEFNPETDFQKYTETNPKADEWNTLMSSFQQKVPEAKPEMWWTPIRLVFDSQWF
jgi:L-rhamnose mutarotase|tara:strand:- start:943 stop:1284 length:342 start_codon:yes stop_codon:yes gene_type:complete